jgi:hypothetical protein
LVAVELVEQPLVLQTGATLYLQRLLQPVVAVAVPVALLRRQQPEQMEVPVVVAPETGLVERVVKEIVVERGSVPEVPIIAVVVEVYPRVVELLPLLLVEPVAQVRIIPQHSEQDLE